jgi:hypothetical protein
MIVHIIFYIAKVQKAKKGDTQAFNELKKEYSEYFKDTPPAEALKKIL